MQMQFSWEQNSTRARLMLIATVKVLNTILSESPSESGQLSTDHFPSSRRAFSRMTDLLTADVEHRHLLNAHCIIFLVMNGCRNLVLTTRQPNRMTYSGLQRARWPRKNLNLQINPLLVRMSDLSLRCAKLFEHTEIYILVKTI